MISKILVSPLLAQRQEEFGKILIVKSLKKDHPDLLYFESDQKLGVAEAKKIREFLSLKPYSSSSRAVVLESAHKLTIEAQNSLLKTLEEPPLNSLIILGVEKKTQLLPTIVSRCQIENLESTVINEKSKDYSKDIEDLINSSFDQRFEYIEKLEEKEKFLESLVLYFKDKFSGDKTNLEYIKQLMNAQMWAGVNVNLRFILEYLMLEMPKKT